MAWTKEQHAANYLKNKENPDWYEKHLERTKNWHQNNPEPGRARALKSYYKKRDEKLTTEPKVEKVVKVQSQDEKKAKRKEAYLKRKQDPIWYEKQKERSRNYALANRQKQRDNTARHRNLDPEKNKARVREYFKKNPQVRVKTRDSLLAKKYGVTLADITKLKTSIICEICEQPFKNTKQKHVDHCHKTMRMRGLLCHHCNLGIGHFKDNLDLIKRAFDYLEKYQTQTCKEPQT